MKPTHLATLFLLLAAPSRAFQEVEDSTASVDPGMDGGTVEELKAGPLRLRIHMARTAHLFHVVDQISDWSPFCHDQYKNAFRVLDAEDRELLAEHRALRARRGWGGGLEQTFYTEASLDEALGVGVSRGWIDEEEAEIEAVILEHFAPRIEALMDQEIERLLAFEERIREGLPTLERLARRLHAFIGGAPPTVPVFLLANPADRDSGGGFNGGRLTVEVPRKADAYGTFLHEVFHAFLDQRADDVTRIVEGHHRRLDYQTMNEGIAHAISPGVHHAFGKGADPLVQRVRKFRDRGQTLEDYSYRVHRFALALRPLVREMLAEEELGFDAFMERALDTWGVMVELELARKTVVPDRSR